MLCSQAMLTKAQQNTEELSSVIISSRASPKDGIPKVPPQTPLHICCLEVISAADVDKVAAWLLNCGWRCLPSTRRINRDFLEQSLKTHCLKCINSNLSQAFSAKIWHRCPLCLCSYAFETVRDLGYKPPCTHNASCQLSSLFLQTEAPAKEQA